MTDSSATVSPLTNRRVTRSWFAVEHTASGNVLGPFYSRDELDAWLDGFAAGGTGCRVMRLAPPALTPRQQQREHLIEQLWLWAGVVWLVGMVACLIYLTATDSWGDLTQLHPI